MSDTSQVLRPEIQDIKVLPVIAGRWSSRAIDADKPVKRDVFDRLIEAARWAPSAKNHQPWRFLAFGPEDAGALDQARSTLVDGNAWAYKAPRLVFTMTKLDNYPNHIALYETGMAGVQMALQAAQEGLVFHQMAGFNANKVRQLFSVPDEFQIITAIAIGWPGSMDNLKDHHKEIETETRTRKSHEELVFFDGNVPSE